MSNDVELYKFDEHGVRTVQEGEQILFCAKDIAEALGCQNTNKAIGDHCHGVTKRYPISDSLGREQQARFITEGDVYRLIASSKLPSAVRFERWLFDECAHHYHHGRRICPPARRSEIPVCALHG